MMKKKNTDSLFKTSVLTILNTLYLIKSFSKIITFLTERQIQNIQYKAFLTPKSQEQIST